MNHQWSRRKFIRKGSAFLVVIFGLFALRKNSFLAQETQPMSTNKSKSNNNKVLVTYESQFASTAEIADSVMQELSKKGLDVTIKKIRDVNNLNDYNRVIIGSAIQYDKWMPESRNFVKENQASLSQKEVSCFFVCLVLSKETEDAKKKANGYAQKISDSLSGVAVDSIGQFAGVLDYGKMTLGQRLAAKMLFAIIGIKAGDYRDWDLIREWAKAQF